MSSIFKDFNSLGSYPTIRARRLRQAPWLRNMVRETSFSGSDLIWPLFIIEGKNEAQPIKAMPGVNRLTIDLGVKAAKQAFDAGIPAIALFPNTPDNKRSERAEESANSDNLICRTIREIKSAVPEIGIIGDVALDPYTTHGHDGILKNGIILNDETLEVLKDQALCLAEAGCDIVAPSDMMDGRVGFIRSALEGAGYKDTLILSYAAKYASSLYGPFRDAVGSGAKLSGDKKTYQMDPANSVEALKEVALDISEGADMVMVKPGCFYLDIVRDVAQISPVPTLAYQVSCEYAMIRNGIDAGLFEENKIIAESLLAFKRAGCTAILSYFALDMAQSLND